MQIYQNIRDFREKNLKQFTSKEFYIESIDKSEIESVYKYRTSKGWHDICPTDKLFMFPTPSNIIYGSQVLHHDEDDNCSSIGGWLGVKWCLKHNPFWKGKAFLFICFSSLHSCEFSFTLLHLNCSCIFLWIFIFTSKLDFFLRIFIYASKLATWASPTKCTAVLPASPNHSPE